jgi:hypothetical protein
MYRPGEDACSVSVETHAPFRWRRGAPSLRVSCIRNVAVETGHPVSTCSGCGKHTTTKELPFRYPRTSEPQAKRSAGERRWYFVVHLFLHGAVSPSQAAGEFLHGVINPPQAAGEFLHGVISPPQAAGEFLHGVINPPQAAGEFLHGVISPPQAAGEFLLTRGKIAIRLQRYKRFATSPSFPNEGERGGENCYTFATLQTFCNSTLVRKRG